MNVVVAVEQRFQLLPDGSVWTASGFRNAFWSRYLDVFDSVVVLARAEAVEVAEADAEPVGNDRITIEPLPAYRGPRGYLVQRGAIRRHMQGVLGPDDAIIARLPGPIGSTLIGLAQRTERPWGAELVGDPYDVFAPGAIRHPLRPVFRHYFPRLLRTQARKAMALSYVSDGVLRERYPAQVGAFTTSYSSVVLEEASYQSSPRGIESFREPFNCTVVGSLEQPYKGVDILLHAMRTLRDGGLDLRLTVIGEGTYRSELESLSNRLGLGDVVSFTGFVGERKRLMAMLDASDLFVLPSRTEGLPRAMIEAMARGIPCVGTTVGGIPDLLQHDEMVPPGDATALAKLIGAVLTDPQRMAHMSERNLEVARRYRSDILRVRRQGFYSAVRDRTQAWVRAGEAS